MTLKNSNSKVASCVTAVLAILFLLLMTFMWYEVLDLDTFSNFSIGLFFWIVNGILLLFGLVGAFFWNMEFAFRVAIIFITIIYTIVDSLWIALALINIGSAMYLFVHLLMVFVYLLFIAPVFVKGINKKI